MHHEPIEDSDVPTCSAEDVVALVSRSAAPGAALAAEWRSWRWMVQLDDRIAFVADDDHGWARLEREALLLARLHHRRELTVPTVVVRQPASRLQIRRKVPGLNGFLVEDVIFGRPGKLSGAERYKDSLVITAAGERLATEIGRAIFGVQQAMTAQEAHARGFGGTDYLDILDRVAAYLPSRADLAPLAEPLPSLRAWYAELSPDPVLAIRDLQMHNIAIDPLSGALRGLFDFDDAAVAHRLEDFKYLPSNGKRFTELALDAYAAAGGPHLRLADVWRFHILSALEHFLFVPESSQRWQEIVAWSTEAFAHQPV